MFASITKSFAIAYIITKRKGEIFQDNIILYNKTIIVIIQATSFIVTNDAHKLQNQFCANRTRDRNSL